MKFYLKPTFLFMLRKWKSGEFRLMAFALFISVASITSIAFLIQGLQAGLEDKAGILLGSDRAIVSPNPIDSSIVEKAKGLDLKVTNTLSFLTMLVHGNELTLADVRAVGSGYPLRGELRTASALFAPDESTPFIPVRGSVWLDARLFPLLEIKVGDKIGIGSAFFKVTRVLTGGPDNSTVENINLAPSVLMNEEDVPITKILQPGSRITYKLLLAGDEGHLVQLESWVKRKLTPAQTWVDIRHNRPMVNMVVDRVNHYLGLVFLINISLAGIAIVMVIRQFTQREFDTVAILRCFGASNNWILSHYLFTLLILGLVFSVLGIISGYGLRTLLINLFFKEIFVKVMGTALVFPIMVGLLTALILLFGFAFPPLLSLRKIAPLRLIRRDLSGPPLSHYTGIFLALFLVAGLIIFQTQDIAFIAPFILLTLGVSLVLLMIIYVILRLIPNLGRFLSILLQFNIRNIGHRAGKNALQVLAFALVLGLLNALYLVRHDLIKTWQDEAPPLAPNHFILNIPPTQLSLFQALLQEHNIETSAIYPMTVGRLMAVNDDLVEMNGDPLSNKRVFNRLLNLTWAYQLQQDNRVIEGDWFGKEDKGRLVISVEQGFADRLKIKLGDMIKLQIAEKILEPTVTSIRVVDWNSFHPNFFVMFPPGVIDQLPITYMTSFYLSPADIGFLKILVQHFPMVSIIDTQMIMSQLRTFIHVVSAAVEYLWGFTVVVSFILLFATITSTLDERKEEAILLRILGVNNRQLLWILLSEFLLLGLLAGIMGVISANIILYWLSHKLFNLPYHLDKVTLIVIPLLGMVLVGLGGWLGTRRVFLTPPLRMMSEV